MRSNRSKHWKAVIVSVSGLGLLLSPRLIAEETREIIETFDTLDYADLENTTGLWNIVAGVAQAGVVANADTARPVSFGDGSDGIVDTADGYTFDTDAHPNGYDFVSLNISGGTVTVTGSNPLIIRSLSTVTISPTLNLRGGTGGNGSSSTSASTTGPSGGTPVASRSAGGKGGDAVTGGASLVVGGSGVNADGTLDTSTPGAGSTASATPGSAGSFSANRPGTNFDAAGGFISGTGGGGGGGHFDGGDATHATGGGGGAAGGSVRIAAVGAISVGTIDARGGNGGSTAPSTAACSGNGAGGNGGAIWLQSLGAITATTANMLITGGTGGAVSGACSAGPNGLSGRRRADSPSSGRPSWASAAPPANNDTTNAAANQTYELVSKVYDLGTYDAVFATAPTITKNDGAGSATVSYSGSTDGVTFGDYVSDIAELSGKDNRYLKFKVTIATASSAAASPTVDKIVIPYGDAGPTQVDVKLSAGCGTLAEVARRSTDREGGNNGPASPTGLLATALWMSAFAASWRLFKVRSRSRTAST